MKIQFLFLISIFPLSSFVMAADSIKDFGKKVLICHEVVTGSDVNLKVETTYTQIGFADGSSVSDATKRTIDLTVDKVEAKGLQQSPQIPANITWDQIQKTKFPFLKDDYADANGTEYRDTYGLYDRLNEEYPGELIHLKAAIPAAPNVIDGKIASHLSINLLLPEERLQTGTFQASGYVNYWLGGDTKSEHVMGLAELSCSRSYESLECLTKENQTELAEIQKRLSDAKAQRPNCDEGGNIAGCVGPLQAAELKYFKSLKSVCP